MHQSDFYKIVHYACHCITCSVSSPEYNDSFNLSFIKKGFFEYRTFRRKDEMHAGRILISKPGFDHTTRHIDQQPDVTATIEFKKDFYWEFCGKNNFGAGWFFTNRDIHSILVSSNPELEYLHNHMLQRVKTARVNTLEMDELVIALLENVINVLGNYAEPPIIEENLKKHHLVTVESAKEYILAHFQENISLEQLAQHCHVSLFHFSRIFKTILDIAPHRYLAEVRLNHAKILLETTRLAVTAIAFDCGFNSLEHFVTAYKKQFHITPSVYRSQIA